MKLSKNENTQPVRINQRLGGAEYSATYIIE